MSRLKLPNTRCGRVFAILVVLVVAGVVAYYVHGAVAEDESAQVTYTTGTVERMTLTSSVSGEGNVQWVDSADVIASMSGTVRYLNATLGDEVEEDQRLFVLDGTRSDRSITAPISGTITALEVESYDELGTGDAIATIIDLDSFEAVVGVTEVDIPLVEVGQKAVITFDALPDLTLTGKVTEVGFTGSNNSGVVSFEIVVTPDVSGADVKGGMTVSVSVITDVVADVLTVPSSAVKSSTDGSYVQVLEDGEPVNVPVEVGMTTGSYVEILSGLSEGQEIIVSTVTAGSTAGTNQPTGGGLLDPGGMPGGGSRPGGK